MEYKTIYQMASKSARAGIFITLILGGIVSQLHASVKPTDVYYLTLGIDESLKAAYGLDSEYKAQPITLNAKPRNVYHKALAVVEEFAALHPGSIDLVRYKKLQGLDSDEIKPSHVYEVLTLIKNYFTYKQAFKEYQGPRESKAPSHVFQKLREVSYHHLEIAKQKDMKMNWATPGRVFEANIAEVVPLLYSLAKEVGVPYQRYGFPMRGQQDIKPRHVYKLLQMTYKKLATYYQNTSGYQPIVLDEIKNLDGVTPADVFDLTKILTAELKVLRGGVNAFDMELSLKYSEWKESKSKIAPGDVYPLVQHAFNIVKAISPES
ncbi:MAG: hypothetical protein AAF984_00035 [Verrucomicrobiota bacterium]